MNAAAKTQTRRLIAARALVARLSPPTPGAWLELDQGEHDRRVAALRLAQRRADELTSSRVLP